MLFYIVSVDCFHVLVDFCLNLWFEFQIIDTDSAFVVCWNNFVSCVKAFTEEAVNLLFAAFVCACGLLNLEKTAQVKHDDWDN